MLSLGFCLTSSAFVLTIWSSILGNIWDYWSRTSNVLDAIPVANQQW